MSRHDDKVTVKQMLDHAQEALAMAENYSREDLDTNRMLELSLIRLVEIIGEAATRVSETFQDAHPSIPWLQARTMRNRLIHGYDAVDFDILWNTIKMDIPELIKELNKIL